MVYRSGFLPFRRTAMALNADVFQNSAIATKHAEPKMLQQIVSHTPPWVFILFIGLIWLGLRQSQARRITRRQAVMLPTAMVALSLVGTVSVFGSSASPLLAWLMSAVCAIALVFQLPLPVGAGYEQASQRIYVPGR
jgi:hypothetical protein